MSERVKKEINSFMMVGVRARHTEDNSVTSKVQ